MLLLGHNRLIRFYNTIILAYGTHDKIGPIKVEVGSNKEPYI